MKLQAVLATLSGKLLAISQGGNTVLAHLHAVGDELAVIDVIEEVGAHGIIGRWHVRMDSGFFNLFRQARPDEVEHFGKIARPKERA